MSEVTPAAPAAPVTPAAAEATPPAAAPVAPAATSVAPAATPAAWHSSFDDETKGWIGNKGFDRIDSADKALPEIIKSARNAEKLLGVPADQILRLPKDGDPEATKAVFTKLGMPEKPEMYELPVPEGDDGTFAKEASAWLHEAHLTKAQAKAVAEKWNGYIASQKQAAAQQQAQKAAEHEATLRKEWGQAYDARIEAAGSVAAKLGITPEHATALRETMGAPGLAKFIFGLAEKMGEDKFVTNESGSAFGGLMTPAQAQSKILQLKSDEQWRTRYVNGGKAEKAEMDSLNAIAYGGKK